MLYMSRMAGNLDKSSRLNNHKSQIGTDAFDLQRAAGNDNKGEGQGGDEVNSNSARRPQI